MNGMPDVLLCECFNVLMFFVIFVISVIRQVIQVRGVEGEIKDQEF